MNQRFFCEGKDSLKIGSLAINCPTKDTRQQTYDSQGKERSDHLEKQNYEHAKENELANHTKDLGLGVCDFHGSTSPINALAKGRNKITAKHPPRNNCTYFLRYDESGYLAKLREFY